MNRLIATALQRTTPLPPASSDHRPRPLSASAGGPELAGRDHTTSAGRRRFLGLAAVLGLAGAAGGASWAAPATAAQLTEANFTGSWQLLVSQPGSSPETNFMTLGAGGTLILTGPPQQPAREGIGTTMFHYSAAHGVWKVVEGLFNATYAQAVYSDTGNLIALAKVQMQAGLFDTGALRGTYTIAVNAVGGSGVEGVFGVFEGERIV